MRSYEQVKPKKPTYIFTQNRVSHQIDLVLALTYIHFAFMVVNLSNACVLRARTS